MSAYPADTTSKTLPDEEDVLQGPPAGAEPLEWARKMGPAIAEGAVKSPGYPFTDQCLWVAAVLKKHHDPAFAVLKAALKETKVNLNDWTAAIKAFIVKHEARAHRAENTRRATDDLRPTILRRAELHEVVDEMALHLAKVPGLFQRWGDLVEVVARKKGVPEIIPINHARLRDITSKAMRFVEGEEMKPILPPKEFVEVLHVRPDLKNPELKGFVEGAAFLDDGQILCKEGFDPKSKFYVRNAAKMSISDKPTRDDAREAYGMLTELVQDFPFADKRADHEAAWVSCLLTILARPAINGCTPMFLFDANHTRVGKTRLADLCHRIVTGRGASKTPYPGGGRQGDVEMVKILTAKALKGDSVVFFDNVKARLGGQALEGAITTQEWSARILGKSEQPDVEVSMTWIATSNHVKNTKDMDDRVIWITLHTNEERPELRDGFKHPDIDRHVKDHREKYLGAALTILRAWHVAGRPKTDFRTFGSFEAWGALIRNAVMFAGGSDPCSTRKAAGGPGSEREKLEFVLEAWPLDKFYTTADLNRLVKDVHSPVEMSDPLGGALSELIPRNGDIGTHLGLNKEQVINGKRLVGKRETKNGITNRGWTVERICHP